MTDATAPTSPRAWLNNKSQLADVDATALARRVEEDAACQEQLALALPLSQRFEQLDDSTYPLPNCFARGGLFGALKLDEDDRPLLKKVTVASLSNYTITYTGEALNQSDLDVAMALFSEAREQPLSHRVLFTTYRLLQRLSWTMNQASYRRLAASLYRLQRGQIIIEVRRPGRRPNRFVGSIISNFGEDDDRALGRAHDHQVHRHVWNVALDERIASLFSEDEVTLGFWFVRRQLDGRQPLAQFLHNFYSTHRDPIALSMSKLLELSQSRDKNPSNFATGVRRALDRLVSIGFLESYRIDNGMVHVVRVAQRVLAARARALLKEAPARRSSKRLAHRDLAGQGASS
jgi:hypothetical protein